MPKQSSHKRSVFRITISAAAKSRLDQINDELGITHIALASRLITWFAEQPDEIKAGIFHGTGDLVDVDPAVRMLELMAEGNS